MTDRNKKTQKTGGRKTVDLDDIEEVYSGKYGYDVENLFDDPVEFQDQKGAFAEASGGEKTGAVSNTTNDRKERKPFIAGKYSTMMAGMAAVLILAGCILGITVVQMIRTGEQLEESETRSEQISQQLGEIQDYLALLDVTVESGELPDSESYEEISATIEALESDLLEYRDNTEIEDEEISGNLDGIIEELAAIQTNISANISSQEEVWDGLDSVGTNVSESVSESVSDSTVTLQESLEDQLNQLQSDIQSLVEEASALDNSNYETLVSLLEGTDSGVEELLSEVASYSSAIKVQLSSGLSDLKEEIALIQSTQDTLLETFDTIYAGEEELSESIETLSSTLTALVSEESDDILAEIGTQSSSLESSISAIAADLTEAIQTQSEMISQLDGLEDLLEDIGDLTESLETIADNQEIILTSMADNQEDVLSRLDDMETSASDYLYYQTAIQEQLTALQSDLSEITEAMNALQDLLETLTEDNEEDTGSSDDSSETDNDNDDTSSGDGSDDTSGDSSSDNTSDDTSSGDISDDASEDTDSTEDTDSGSGTDTEDSTGDTSTGEDSENGTDTDTAGTV